MGLFQEGCCMGGLPIYIEVHTREETLGGSEDYVGEVSLWKTHHYTAGSGSSMK